MLRRSHRALIVLTLAASSTPALAATAAYWRHEEGPAGTHVPDGANVVLDSSGNDNHMRTFNAGRLPANPLTAATYTNSIAPLPLRSGIPNTLALDFGPGGDDAPGIDANRNDDNYSEGKSINSQTFSAMTVELAFNMHAVGNGAWQAVFGKDGKPLGDADGEDDRPVPPFKVLIRNDDFPEAIPNQLFIEFVDGDGTLASDIHFLASGFTVQPNTWYHVAFTLNADTAQLWVATNTGPYTLVDSIQGADFLGPADEVLVFDPTPWSIGRGMFGNGPADWANAIIDEVRISDTVLPPTEFLFDDTQTALVPGDADGDGDVDLDDIAIWASNFTGSLTPGTGPGTHATGDWDTDKDVDLDDQSIWATGFTGSLAAGSLASVPEPSSLAACALALLPLTRRRTRN